MTRTLYATMVGIDEYPSPVPPLSGCVNDIEAVSTLLRAFYKDSEIGFDLQILRNCQATRVKIVRSFREHLCRAGHGDVVLFYYSGHGSQEDTPPEFWHLEPDRLDETLVCYDSRNQGCWDLADKELALLISEVAARGPHILCVLDCCHSGSGTRAALEDGLAVRRAPTDRRRRPVESFLEGSLASRSVNQDKLSSSNWGVVPEGRHLLLAACRSSETAKEVAEGGKPHGAFTVALLSALRQTRGSITYRDLLKRAEAHVRLRVAQQVPQIEASDPADLLQPFLGGAARKARHYFSLRFDRELNWVIDGGAIHGLVKPSVGDATIFAIFGLDTDPSDWRRTDAALALAEMRELCPDISRVELKVHGGGDLDRQSTYRAITIATPLPAKGVYLSGDDDEALKLLRRSLETSGPGSNPSLLVRETEAEDQAYLHVNVAKGIYKITRPRAERALVAEVEGCNENGALLVVDRLEHIARWEAVAKLGNGGSQFADDAVEITVFLSSDGATGEIWAKADPRGGIKIEYQYVKGKWQQPRLRIELKNNANVALYCALLWLGEDYSISSALIPGGIVHIPAGNSVAANNGKDIYGSVPREKWKEGRTEVTDLLKLIVSTEQFDSILFEQEPLDRYVRIRAVESAGFRPRNGLERLAKRVHLRALAIIPEQDEAIADWTTSELALTVIRPLETNDVPPFGKQRALGAGVTLMGHKALKAKVRLVSPSETRQALGDFGLPAIFLDDPSVSQPFLFANPRGTDSGLGALQLIGVENVESVTADEPLRLRTNAQLIGGEHVLPVAWDGEFYLPLGTVRPIDEGIEIELRQLPVPIQTASDVERGIVSSVRILFQKILSSKLGTGFDYPHLAAVSFDAQGTARYEMDADVIRERVTRANRILLYIHGILGDTLGMTASSATEVVPSHRIGDRYDLVLAFDYENINTGIKETARKLGERLADVGLGPRHDKTLHVAAHSMGGLVSRWFIEREGGHQVVQHLVTLGTPHAGSPWPKIQDWATSALAIGLNGFTQIAWPVKVLGDLVGAIENVDVMLDEMASNSSLLVELGKNFDPKVPYTLLVGNTSIIPAIVKDDRLGRLLSKLSPQRLIHVATSLAFLRSPNDIAVAVSSAQAVPLMRDPEPKISEVACDHLTFFNSQAGLQALFSALLSVGD